jgi:predicted adenylyl cyclase CyaB
MNIEVEVRSFITKDKYDELISFFKENGEYQGEDYQETFYFDCEQDLRIQKSKEYSKVWMKKGKLHDDHREEIEIKFDKDYFETLEKLFLGLGYNVEIKWFRTRHTFLWQGVSVMVDYSKGYGYILELEKMSGEEGKDEALLELKGKMFQLGVPVTPKEEFKRKYLEYKANWRDLVE